MLLLEGRAILRNVTNRNLKNLLRVISRFEHTELTNSVKLDIEKRWSETCEGSFDPKDASNKFYVLSMFPYPSGNLHMGHVRVYTIGDTMARFYRMSGKNVFHPVGWDAFGLPAENAAIQRKVDPTRWTQENIAQMKHQMRLLGCSFDWNHELSTCDKSYYKWTQKLFLMLHKEGLAYQKEALVNWDPVDKTVLADEQVDANGRSWRSGAKVEKKLLKQWFIRTTKFAKDLLDGLSDPTLQEWRDIINLQRHWIGDCNGYAFDLKVVSGNETVHKSTKQIRLWTDFPENFLDPSIFVALKGSHYLKQFKTSEELKVFNPFTKKFVPIIFSDEVNFPEHCDTYLACPGTIPDDSNLAEKLGLSVERLNSAIPKNGRKTVLEIAQKLNIGGFPVSSKLQDWLISRQRKWGTPIPIVYCDDCGAVPVNEEELPVQLEKISENPCICPTCKKGGARRETDTMDTFVDSSWYFLRYIDANNEAKIFDTEIVSKYMPVDLYIGGKEHAVLHLYYARFMNHFLHSLGLVPKPEPFLRLLVQGMVMGRSYRVKDSGVYIKENEIKVVDAKKNKAVEVSTGKQVVMSWEKMSKSKLNGVDPSDMISEYGCDTTRLIILGDVAPTSHRNWSTATFPGILNWQKRLWMTINEFSDLRKSSSASNLIATADDEFKMFDARNYYVRGATFNYRHTHQLSVGISKMQGLTNSIRRAQKNVIVSSKQYERALAAQIIMLAPMAPHFASELWSIFIAAPGRLDTRESEISWSRGVLQQKWPDVDVDYELDLTFKVNGFETAVVKMPRYELDKLTYEKAMEIAQKTTAVKDYIGGRTVRHSNFVLYHGCDAILSYFLERNVKSDDVLEDRN